MNLNQGKLDITIPLIDFIDKDFNFPIALSYDSGGFKPATPDNFVGRDWTLICGGAVTREVNGIPDDIREKQIAPDNFATPVKGFLHRNKQSSGPTVSKAQLKSRILADPYNYSAVEFTSIPMPTVPPANVESFADFYRFFTSDMSGQFMMNYDGSVSSGLSSGNPGSCTVDLSRYDLADANTTYSSRIVVKTDNDYTYTFGGDGFSSLEFTPLTWDAESWFIFYEYPYGKKPVNEISAYYLTEIQAPNGRKLKIRYRDVNLTYHVDPHRLASTSKETLMAQGTHLQYSLSGGPYCDIRHAALPGYQPYFPSFRCSLTKQVLIDYIQTDDTRIQFYYSARAEHPQYSTRNKFPDICGAKLDSVVMTSNISAHKETTRLLYRYDCGKRMFLASVRNSLRGNHDMQYYTENCHITPMTSSLDHWGYWTGDFTEKKQFIPSFAEGSGRYNSDDTYTYSSNHRSPTGARPEATLLKRITYPTGGFSDFTYEPHTYNYVLLQFFSSSFVPSMSYGQSKIAGGARIKRVQHYAGATLAREVRYRYTRDGELMFMPYYRIPEIVPNFSSMTETIHGFYANSSGVNLGLHRSEYIRYPQVTEYYIDGPTDEDEATLRVPRKVSEFSTYFTNPDYFDKMAVFSTIQYKPFRADDLFVTTTSKHQNQNLGIRPDLNAESERGKIKSESYHDASGRTLRTIFYNYERIHGDTAVYIYMHPIVKGLAAGAYTHVGLQTYNKFELKERSVREWNSGGSGYSTTSENYSYNKQGYLVSEYLVRERGDSTVTVYRYNNGYAFPPDRSIYDAGTDGRRLVFTEAYRTTRVNNPVLNSSWREVSGYAVGDGETTKTLVSYSNYDLFGNPCYRTDDNGLQTVYIWGYNGKYLMAKIENANYFDVQAALGMMPENMSYATGGHTDKMNRLRGMLPDANVYTYTYIPYVGLKSVIDPAGHVQEYTYDDHARMKTAYRRTDAGSRELLQYNHYHIINE